MTHARNDPTRRCLKVEEWPDVDRRAWEAARRPDRILDGEVGNAYRWSPDTTLKNRKGYGRWITFLTLRGWLDIAERPTTRITPERVGAYLEELRTEVASWTVRNRIAELLAMATAFDPSGNWRWLKRLLSRLDAVVEDSRPKLPRMRPAHEILGWAFQTMESLAAKNRTGVRDAVKYRDALMIGLLILCPILRRRNLADIRLDRHLRSTSRGFVLVFASSETKTRQPIEAPVPEELGSCIRLFLDRYRPLLLRHHDASSLWVSWKGKPMSAMALYHRITKVTERAFGTPINPHLFRDCAVTTVAIEDPVHIGIAPHILGHDSTTTTHRHYNQARSVEASRRLHDTIERLKDSLPSPQATGAHRRDRGGLARKE